MTWWSIAATVFGLVCVANVAFVLGAAWCARHEERQREVTRDDLDGLHVFDDDDLF